MNVKKYPVDFESLTKGTTIPALQLQEICGHPIGSTKYNFFIMSLCQQIMDYKRDSDPVTVIVHLGNVQILTDSEAVIYNKNDFTRRERGMFRAHKRQLRINPASLTPEEKIIWERSVINQSYIVQSVQKAKKQIRIEASKRNTPGLLE